MYFFLNVNMEAWITNVGLSNNAELYLEMMEIKLDLDSREVNKYKPY